MLSLVCLICAGMIAYNKSPGWGWFLLAAILLAGYS